MDFLIVGDLSEPGRKCSGLLPDGGHDPDRVVGQPEPRVVSGAGSLPLLPARPGSTPAARHRHPLRGQRKADARFPG